MSGREHLTPEPLQQTRLDLVHRNSTATQSNKCRDVAVQRPLVRLKDKDPPCLILHNVWVC